MTDSSPRFGLKTPPPKSEWPKSPSSSTKPSHRDAPPGTIANQIQAINAAHDAKFDALTKENMALREDIASLNTQLSEQSRQLKMQAHHLGALTQKLTELISVF